MCALSVLTNDVVNVVEECVLWVINNRYGIFIYALEI